VLAVLEARGERPLADRLRSQDEALAGDFISLLTPLEKTKTLAFGDLASIRKHLTEQAADSEETARMKRGVKDLLPIMEVLEVIKECKELVTYLKSSGLAADLPKKVLQEVETRWNSLHTMLESVLDSYDEIHDLLTKHGDGGVRRMDGVDRQVQEWLVPFLKEFKMETKTLEGNNSTHPTLPFLVLVSAALEDHCQPSLDDGMHLTLVKARSLCFLNEKFKPSMKAKVALFLWPDYKELLLLSEDERNEVNAKVRALIAENGSETDGGGPNRREVDDPDVPDGPPPPKTARAESQDEVARYLSMATSVPAELLLQFWKMMDRPDGFPKLARLARRELGNLSTAAPSERVWSKTSFILNNRRNRLTPKHLNSIIVLCSWLRHLEKSKK
ncbi:Transposable element Hobo transposase, partial [Frankliniella fusca]